MNLFDSTFRTLERSLDFSMTKNRTIANNIANLDTPNYKAQKVVFKDVLSNEIKGQFTAKRTHPKHIPFQGNEPMPYFVKSRTNTTYNHNGNNVDIDKEMTELAQNQIYYQALVDRINGKFGKIQTVLRGGN